MKITILTLFPEFFTGPLQTSILKRASDAKLVEFQVINIRDFTQDKHHVTDDRPFGGGPGMVMKVEPIYKALESLNLVSDGKRIRTDETKVVLTSAKGKLFNQDVAREYQQISELVIICGHYEGVDERVAEHLIDEEVRIGDYVLTGGEAAAVVMADAVSRLIPGVLGNQFSNKDESHTEVGVLGYPQYTRPEVFRDWSVPAVLLQGNHAQIGDWRQQKKTKLAKD